MMDSTGDAPGDGKGAPETLDATRRVLRIAVTTVLGALLTGWLAQVLPAWPIGPATPLPYLLVLPFLMVPPAWTLLGGYALWRLLRRPPRPGGWRLAAAMAAPAVLLAVAVLPGYGRALLRLVAPGG